MRRLRRIALFIGAAILVFAGVCASQIAYVQFGCIPAGSTTASGTGFGIDDPKYARAEGDSFLTYPEWYIVYAYSDLAGVTHASSESSFDYLRSIRGFWSSLCEARRATSAARPPTQDQMITNYIIGSSFTAEMAVQGSYERTIGALTAAWRGSARTKEDELNQALLDDYAKFLEQTPWYQYPFSDKLSVLWKDVPFELSLRSIERRFSLSLQYGVKSIYAKAIGALAGLSPADLEIGSVVVAPSVQALPSDDHIRVVREVRSSDGKQGVLIVTPRYQEFTDIIRGIGAKNLRFGEIAGNTRILTTVLVPPTIGNGVSLTADGRLASDTGDGLLMISGVRQIFETEVQSMPGWRRVGYDTDVATVATFAARIGETGIRFEHAYDY